MKNQPATLKNLIQTIHSHANPEKAIFLQRFFKTGPGQYAEGDQLLGINVPVQRQIAKQFQDLPLSNLPELIQSPYHEMRVIALFIAIHHFNKALKSDLPQAEKIIQFYLEHTAFINNWDLVDLSAANLTGHWFYDKDRSTLHKLAHSNSLWERRIAIVSSYYFLKRNDFQDTFKIAEILLQDKHDLIHKAVGWMLREVGKKDQSALDQFLANHYQQMPRTMLRYAIEKYPEKIRQKYLHGKI